LPHDTGRRKATMGNCSGLMTPSPPPSYKPYHRVPGPTNKLPSGYSKDMNHPPSYTPTRTAIAERHSPKGDNRGSHAGKSKGGIVSRILNLFRKDRKDDGRDSDGLEWPPRGTKYLTDPSLPLRLTSPFDPKFRGLKARAKTQEEWEELRRIQGRHLQPSPSRKSGNRCQRRTSK
jgi:hypothetical protein